MKSYAVCSLVGILCGLWIAGKLKMPLPPKGHRAGLYVFAVAGLILGAKIPVWLSYGITVLQGKSVLGGMLGAFLAINLYKWFAKQQGHSFGGRFVIPLAVAVGFGKIGCYLAGCCGGTLAVPVQLVESGFSFACAGFLYWLYRRTQRVDLLFPVYLLLYLSMRFIIEFWRLEPRVLGGLTVYQWLALAFLPLFFLILWRRTHATLAATGR